MKKINLTAIIAMALCIAVSCTKEKIIPAEESVDPVNTSAPAGIYPATISAGIEQPEPGDKSKMSISGTTLSWATGDQIAVFKYTADVYTSEDQITTMTAKDDEGTFSGEVPFPGTNPFYLNFVSPSSAVTGLHSSQAGTFRINIPVVQDGRASNIGESFLTMAANVKCIPTIVDDKLVSFSPESPISMNRHCVIVVKVNVPAALDARSIVIQAYKDDTQQKLAGTGLIKYNRQLRINPLSSASLTIKRSDDNQISGDTYACMIPLKAYTNNCDVNKLSFKITNGSSESYTFSKAVTPYVENESEGLQQGKVYNLGSFPTACIAPKISLVDGKVVMTATPAEAKIYYTSNGDTPTASSTEYTGPFLLTEDTDFKAIAVQPGLDNSTIATQSLVAGAVAPVLSVIKGKLVIDKHVGQNYTYSMSTSAEPEDPTNDWPDSVAVNTTGTYYFKVMASKAGQTETTNAVYRVFYVSSQIPSGTSVIINAGESNTTQWAPTTIWNTHNNTKYDAENLTIKRGNNGQYWKFDGGTTESTKALIGTDIEIGVNLLYTSKVSVYVFHRALSSGSKKVNVYFNNSNVGSGSTSGGVWYNAWNSTENCTAGDKLNLRTVNGSEFRGWGFLEQGFADFDGTKATTSNEKPATGGTVSY